MPWAPPAEDVIVEPAAGGWQPPAEDVIVEPAAQWTPPDEDVIVEPAKADFPAARQFTPDYSAADDEARLIAGGGVLPVPRTSLELAARNFQLYELPALQAMREQPTQAQLKAWHPSLWERFRNTTFAHKLLGPTPVERSFMESGALAGPPGGDVGVLPLLMATPMPFLPVSPESKAGLAAADYLGKAMLGYFVAKHAADQPERLAEINELFQKGQAKHAWGKILSDVIDTSMAAAGAHGLHESFGHPFETPHSAAARMFSEGVHEGDLGSIEHPAQAGAAPRNPYIDAILRQGYQPAGSVAEPVLPPPPKGFSGVPRGPRVEVPGTPAEPRENLLDEIRRTGAKTKAEIQALYPNAQLNNEAARALSKAAWGEGAPGPGEAPAGALPSVPIEQPGAAAPGKSKAEINALLGDLLDRAWDFGEAGHELPTRTEVEEHYDVDFEDRQWDAVRSMHESGKSFAESQKPAGEEAAPAPPQDPFTKVIVKDSFLGAGPISEPALPAALPGLSGVRAPRPEVPSTPGEPYEHMLAEIRRRGAKTKAEIQALFPKANLSNEQARGLSKEAWGAEAPGPGGAPTKPPPPPPEAPPEEPPTAGVPVKPTPKPPAPAPETAKGKPDKSYYIQSDGTFAKLREADESAIPYSIARPEAQARWPRLPVERVIKLTPEDKKRMAKMTGIQAADYVAQKFKEKFGSEEPPTAGAPVKPKPPTPAPAPSKGAPDRSYSLQSDGRFVKLDEADDSAIPFFMASPEQQARWPREGGTERPAPKPPSAPPARSASDSDIQYEQDVSVSRLRRAGVIRDLNPMPGSDLIKFKGQPAGWIHVSDDGVINAIEISPAFRRKGVGSSVLRDIAKTQGTNRLKVFLPTEQGLEFLSSLGKLEVNEHGEGTLTLGEAEPAKATTKGAETLGKPTIPAAVEADPIVEPAKVPQPITAQGHYSKKDAEVLELPLKGGKPTSIYVLNTGKGWISTSDSANSGGPLGSERIFPTREAAISHAAETIAMDAQFTLRRPGGHVISDKDFARAQEELDWAISHLTPEAREAAYARGKAASRPAPAPPARTGSPEAAIKLRVAADALQKQIDQKRKPAIGQQNVTARRARIAEGMEQDADRLEQQQKWLTALAAAHEARNVPESLKGVTRRPQLELLQRQHAPTPGVHRHWLTELLKESQGRSGSVAPREVLSGVQYRGDAYIPLSGDREWGAVKALADIVRKSSPGSMMLKNVDEQIKERNTLAKVGWDTKEQFEKAKADIRELAGPGKTETPQAVKLRQMERALIGTTIPGFFPTPKPVIDLMVERAGIEPGQKVLEPSAGKGDIADAIKEKGVTPDVAEVNSTLADILRAKGYDPAGDFLSEALPETAYDRIVMNPPFENGADALHVRRAYDLLKPGGKLVAVMGEGSFFRTDKRAADFRDWLKQVGGTSEKLADKSFTGRESFRQTGVAGRLVEITKPGEAAPAPLKDLPHQPKGTKEGVPVYGREAYKDLFDRFGVPNAVVTKPDEVFGRGMALFVDDETGKPVAYIEAPPAKPVEHGPQPDEPAPDATPDKIITAQSGEFTEAEKAYLHEKWMDRSYETDPLAQAMFRVRRAKQDFRKMGPWRDQRDGPARQRWQAARAEIQDAWGAFEKLRVKPTAGEAAKPSGAEEDLTPDVKHFEKLKELRAAWLKTNNDMGAAQIKVESFRNLRRPQSMSHRMERAKRESEANQALREAQAAHREADENERRFRMSKDVESYDFDNFILQDKPLPPDRVKKYPRGVPPEMTEAAKPAVPEPEAPKPAPPPPEPKPAPEPPVEPAAPVTPVVPLTPGAAQRLAALEKSAEVTRKAWEKAEEISDAAGKARESRRHVGTSGPEWTSVVAADNAAKLAAVRAKSAYDSAASDLSLHNWREQVRQFRGVPQPEGTKKITATMLKGQKEYLLGEVEKAIAAAPDEAAAGSKIVIDVPGDGTFTLINSKRTLRNFRDFAAKEFPTTTSGPSGPGLPSTSARNAAKVGEPKPGDLGKLVGEYLSTDESRYVLQSSYADGTQIVATDGSQMVRIVTDKAPGAPARPVALDEKGKVVTREGRYPNWKAVMGKDSTLVRGGVDTQSVFHIARQAKVFRDTSSNEKARETTPVELLLNPDGSFGGRMTMPGGESFEHNVQTGATTLGAYNPDFLINAMNVSRKLGNERVDLLVSGDAGPLVVRGKNHEVLMMPVRLDAKVDAVRDVKAFKPHQATHRALPEGYGPIEDPELARARAIGTDAGNFQVKLEDGKLTLSKIEKDPRGEEQWKEVGTAQLADWPTDQKGQSEVVRAMLEGTGKTHVGNVVRDVREGFKSVVQERQEVLDEAARRITPKGMGARIRPRAQKQNAPTVSSGGEPEPSPLWEHKNLRPLLQDISRARALVAPQTLGAPARYAGNVLRMLNARLANEMLRADEALTPFRADFDRTPIGKEWSYTATEPLPRNLAFIDAYEGGRVDRLPPHERAAAEEFQKQNQQWLARVHALGTGALRTFYENYFPHIWDDPAKAHEVFAKLMAKRPLEGPKSFMKQRTHALFTAGLEAGLRPVHDNPVDLWLLKKREVERYILGQNFIKEMKAAGLLKFVHVFEKPPDNYSTVNDRAFEVYGPPHVTVGESFDASQRKGLLNLLRYIGSSQQRLAKLSHRNALGLAWPPPIRANEILVGADETTAWHELGHQMHWKYPDLSERLKMRGNSPMAKQLRGLVDLRGEGQDPSPSRLAYFRETDEKMAEIFKAYIHAPDLFQKVAPLVWDEMNAWLHDHPDIMEKMEAMKPRLAHGMEYTNIPINGLVKIGNYYLPSEAARVVNNYLSPGLNPHLWYRTLREASNLMNGAQLGMSAFHLGFTSLDAATSRLSLAIKDAADGRPGRALRTAASVPFAPVTNIRAGIDLRRAALGDSLQKRGLGYLADELVRMLTPEQFPPEQAKELVSALESAGGRVGQDRFWQTEFTRRMMRSLREGTASGYLKGAVQAPMALVEQAMRPIMEYVVPRQKLGVFVDMARRELEALGPDAHPADVREAMRKAWDSVDNRMGQLVYDNLFYNRAVKDLALLSFRAYGWQIGKYREGVGAMIDVARAGKALAAGERPEFTHRMGYAMALPIMVGLLGGITTYLMTGRRPQGKDWFMPPTGELDSNGNPARVNFPSYMKDVLSYSRHPLTSLGHSLNPLLSSMFDLLQNEDFYGVEIRHPDDPLLNQLGSVGRFAAKQFVPFSVSGAMKLRDDASPVYKQIAPFFGVTPVPSRMTMTPAQELAAEVTAGAMPSEPRTQEQYDRSQIIKEAVRGLKTGNPEKTKAFGQAITSGKLRPEAVTALIDRLKYTPFQFQVSHMDATAAMRVWRIANADERQQLQQIMVLKVTGSESLAPDVKQKYLGEIAQPRN